MSRAGPCSRSARPSSTAACSLTIAPPHASSVASAAQQNTDRRRSHQSGSWADCPPAPLTPKCGRIGTVDESELRERLHTAATSSGVLGAQLSMSLDGRRTEVAHGVLDSRVDTPALPSSPFRLGSITKTVTATVLRSLLDLDGRSVDEPVERLLPGTVPPQLGPSPITWRHVLMHRTGIDGTYWQGFGDDPDAIADVRQEHRGSADGVPGRCQLGLQQHRVRPCRTGDRGAVRGVLRVRGARAAGALRAVRNHVRPRGADGRRQRSPRDGPRRPPGRPARRAAGARSRRCDRVQHCGRRAVVRGSGAGSRVASPRRGVDRARPSPAARPLRTRRSGGRCTVGMARWCSATTAAPRGRVRSSGGSRRHAPGSPCWRTPHRRRCSCGPGCRSGSSSSPA